MSRSKQPKCPRGRARCGVCSGSKLGRPRIDAEADALLAELEAQDEDECQALESWDSGAFEVYSEDDDTTVYTDVVTLVSLEMFEEMQRDEDPPASLVSLWSRS